MALSALRSHSQLPGAGFPFLLEPAETAPSPGPLELPGPGGSGARSKACLSVLGSLPASSCRTEVLGGGIDWKPLIRFYLENSN